MRFCLLDKVSRINHSFIKRYIFCYYAHYCNSDLNGSLNICNKSSLWFNSESHLASSFPEEVIQPSRFLKIWNKKLVLVCRLSAPCCLCLKKNSHNNFNNEKVKIKSGITFSGIFFRKNDNSKGYSEFNIEELLSQTLRLAVK